MIHCSTGESPTSIQGKTGIDAEYDQLPRATLMRSLNTV